MIDKTALREAVINAMVHNDYTREMTPVIEIYSDRLAMVSYGGLVQGLSKEDFFNGRSMIRNRELMRVFKDLKFVEQVGSGMSKILQAYSKDVFHFSESLLEVCFGYEQGYLESLEVGEKRGEKRGEKLSENRLKILNSMHSDPFVSQSQLAKLVGIGQTSIEKNIKYLKDHKWIRRVGPAKGGHWEII